MSTPRIFLPKNYPNWWKFDEVLTKTNLHSFLRHGVYCFCCVYSSLNPLKARCVNWLHLAIQA